MLDKRLELSLSQILDIIWVWQCECKPKYLPNWKNYNCSCGRVLNPEKHIEEYNSLLEQLCSAPSPGNLDYTKAAMSMLRYNSILVFSFLEKPNAGLGKLPRWGIDAAKQIKEPDSQAKQKARALIKMLLTVGDDGTLAYAVADSAITFPFRDFQKSKGLKENE